MPLLDKPLDFFANGGAACLASTRCYRAWFRDRIESAPVLTGVSRKADPAKLPARVGSLDSVTCRLLVGPSIRDQPPNRSLGMRRKHSGDHVAVEADRLKCAASSVG